MAAPVRAAVAPAPASPVAIARCQWYDASIYDALRRMFDQLGGIGKLVRDKTVAIKLNLTGPPDLRLAGSPVGSAQWVHWGVIGVLVNILGEEGARRIRMLESCGDDPGTSLESYMARAG